MHAGLCGTLLSEAERNLRNRTEEAQDSYRRFVDASAELRAANEELVRLKKDLDEKNRALQRRERDLLQMISYLRALVQLVDAQETDDNRLRTAAK